MKQAIKTSILILFLSGSTSFGLSDNSKHKCFDPGRVSFVCFNMHHLRSHVQLIEEQRDMLRMDYKTLENVGHSMEQVISTLIVSRFYNEHLRTISGVRALAKRLEDEAKQKNFQAMRTANMIKGKCQSCHALNSSEVIGESAPSWESVFAMDWASITKRCNESGRNPYVCKHMYAMSNMFSFYDSAFNANQFDFALAASAADELAKLATEMLAVSGGAHEGGTDPFFQVKAAALELKELALKKDPYVYQRSQEVKAACDSCHASP